jgi:hypothetical protein
MGSFWYFCLNGLLTHADTMVTEVVIVKSKAIEQMKSEDGMSEEDAQEHWDYNIAGSLGASSYSCVDDTLCPDQLDEILENDSDIINAPINGNVTRTGNVTREQPTPESIESEALTHIRDVLAGDPCRSAMYIKSYINNLLEK